jgi:hypothetical protein
MEKKKNLIEEGIALGESEPGTLPEETPSISFDQQCKIRRRSTEHYSGLKEFTVDGEKVEKWSDISDFTLDLIRSERRVDTEYQTCNYVLRVNPATDALLAAGPIETVVEPHDFTSSRDFETVILSRGRFTWHGSETQFRRVRQMVLQDPKAPEILLKDISGYDPKNRCWFAANGVIVPAAPGAAEGKVVLADKDGLIRVGNKTYRMEQPPEMNVDGEQQEERYKAQLPRLMFDFRGDPVEAILKPFVALMVLMYGKAAMLAVAWHLTMIFGNEFYRLTGNHPSLLLHSPQDQGKNTLGSLLMKMWGETNEPTALRAYTITSLYTKLNVYNNVPLWIDEYRPGHADDDIQDALKNSYNRSQRDVGTLDQFKTKTRFIRTSLMLSGEFAPTDPALGSRNIAVGLEAHHNVEKLQEATRLSEFLSAVTTKLLLNKALLWPLIRDRFDVLVKRFRAECGGRVDTRIVVNYAKAAAVYEVVMNDFDSGIAAEFMKHMMVKQESNHDSNLALKMLRELPLIIKESRAFIAHRIDRKHNRFLIQAQEMRQLIPKYTKDKELINRGMIPADEFIKLAKQARIMDRLHADKPTSCNVVDRDKDGNQRNTVQKGFIFDMTEPVVEEVANKVGFLYGTSKETSHVDDDM